MSTWHCWPHTWTILSFCYGGMRITWPPRYPWGGAAAAGRCPSWTPPALCGHCSFSVPPFLAFNDSFSERDNSEISHQKRRSLTQKANTSMQVSNSPGRCILKIHFFFEWGLHLQILQFKTKSGIFIHKNIHSIESKIFIQKKRGKLFNIPK